MLSFVTPKETTNVRFRVNHRISEMIMSNTSKTNLNLNANIFIIDDEELVTEVIKMFLEEAGYKNLHVFTDSVEAIETMSYVQVDLILTDVDMPELSGKFLAKLARRTPHLAETPIMVISSDESDETRNNLLGNGVSHILPKPVAREDLLKNVEELLTEKTTDDTQPENRESATEVKEKEQSLRKAFKR